MSFTPVLIVGAGPTGLMLAIELARRGLRPRIVDAGPPDHRESRAVAVVARSLEMLDDLGLAEELIDRGIPLRSLDFYAGAKRVASLDTTAVDSPFPTDLCVPQWQTIAVLREHAEALGVHIEWNTRLTSLRQHGTVHATVQSPAGTQACDAEWVIGCDGSHSAVRSQAGIGWQTDDLGKNFILGDLTAPWSLSRDRFHVWFSRRGLVAVFPMPGGIWRVLVSIEADAPPQPRVDDFADAVGERTPLSTDLTDLVWSSAFVAREGLADRFRAGRVLLAGDAAHSHSPIGGQGMNTGLQDAYNLGWKLAARVAGASDDLLDTYAGERRPMAKAVVDATSMATRIATVRGLLTRRARGHALALASQFPAVQRRFSAVIGEHLVHYRDSPLSVQDWSHTPAAAWSDPTSTGPEAGEVFCDGYLETRDGVVPLRHLLRRPGYHLLLFSGAITEPEVLRDWQARAREAVGPSTSVTVITRGQPAGPVPERMYRDPRSEVHNRYGVRVPSLYVIRPDKYVGYRSDRLDFDGAGAYLRAFEPRTLAESA